MAFFLTLIPLFRVGFDFYRELWEWESKSEGFPHNLQSLKLVTF